MSSFYIYAQKIHKKLGFRNKEVRVKDVEELLKTFMDCVEDELFEKGRVVFLNRFSIKKPEIKERRIFNIRTKQKEKRKVVRFRFSPSKKWKEKAKGE